MIEIVERGGRALALVANTNPHHATIAAAVATCANGDRIVLDGRTYKITQWMWLHHTGYVRTGNQTIESNYAKWCITVVAVRKDKRRPPKMLLGDSKNPHPITA